MTTEIIAKSKIQQWKKNGHETTHYNCQHCNGQVEIRKPEPTMIPPGKKFWQGVKECYICHGLTIVRTWPNGNTETE